MIICRARAQRGRLHKIFAFITGARHRRRRADEVASNDASARYYYNKVGAMSSIKAS